jgi:HSP20 family molecular chaperone IbpA
MIKKLTTLSVAAALTLAVSLQAQTLIPNLNSQVEHNKQLIKEYKTLIQKLEKRNSYLLEEKKKNPKLYETKPLYEDTKEAYINRIKLNGAKANNINFTIENHQLAIEMNIKTEHKDENSYYANSQYFFQSYPIPSDVEESKIKHGVEGDYFVITMPKKAK